MVGSMKIHVYLMVICNLIKYNSISRQSDKAKCSWSASSHKQQGSWLIKSPLKQTLKPVQQFNNL